MPHQATGRQRQPTISPLCSSPRGRRVGRDPCLPGVRHESIKMKVVSRARAIQVLRDMSIPNASISMADRYRAWSGERVTRCRFYGMAGEINCLLRFANRCSARCAEEQRGFTQFVPAPAKLSMYCPRAQSWQCPGSSQSVTRGSSKSPAWSL